MEFSHIPVLLNECLEGLAIDPTGIYLDGTAGGGGHSSQIARRLTTGRLVSLDQDPDAIEAAGKALEGVPATLVQTNLSIDSIAESLGFCNTSHFIRRFSEATGLSPVKYRKAQIQRIADAPISPT